MTKLEIKKKIIDLIQQIYQQPGGAVGGNLHIVLDDYNVDDDSILWCALEAIPDNYHDTDIEKEYQYAALLLAIPVKDRKDVIESRWVKVK